MLSSPVIVLKTTDAGCGVHGTKPEGYQLYYRFCCQVFVICWNDTPEVASDSPGFWFLGTTLLALWPRASLFHVAPAPASSAQLEIQY